MDLRRDALAGAAEAMGELERIVRASPSGTTVGTVGVMRALPGAINVVPGEAELDVDVRDSDLAAREQVVGACSPPRARSPARRGLELEVTPIVEDVPVACDGAWSPPPRRRRASSGLPYRRMTSGAYHDAMIMGARVPIGMIFVPSAGGISHHPDEHTDARGPRARRARCSPGTLARLAA